MAKQKTVISFDKVDFEYKGAEKIILKEASFSISQGQKFALMGQNGAGKSTIFKLITGELKRQDGKVNVDQGSSIAVQRQTMDPKYKELNVREFFEAQFTSDEPIYDIDRRIEKALEAVNFSTPYEKIIKDFSGGQQARLLLASALIQDPDILLLDEPTNNLDSEGIGHLIGFLMMYEKTVLVISHDSEFLNLFTDGVIYLDVHSKTVQKYMGDYHSVVDEIEAQRKREEMKNSRLLKEIQAKKEKANVFAHKGGKLRAVAKRMREVASEAEDNMVEVRKEDKTISDFEIPLQAGTSGLFMEITKLQIMKNHELFDKKVAVEIRKNDHLLLSGPNGIGKTTLLRTLSKGTQDGIFLNPDV
ncbi:TPA: ABC-F family ATP-binding cassette domain-containing protein, partial [Candidatus Gracilibacteria bacterium]|nr:ABC-F family ATP-binding cassette domain-containing protein [Candidatus Gracilibacteria bacterium]